GEAADAHHRVRIFCVDVKNGNALAARDAGGETRRVFLRRASGEADEIVDDDMDRAADGISSKIRKIERFGEHALPSIGRVAMHNDGPNLVEDGLRVIDLRALDAMAGLLGARASPRYRIDCFPVAGIGNEVNVQLLARGSGVHAGGANVILHIARAQYAARVDIFEARDHFMRRFAGDVGHNVQGAAVAHGHDRIDAAAFTRYVENGIEQRNERGVALKRKAFAAQIAALQNLLEKIGTNQALENFCLADLELRTFHALSDPPAPLRLGEMIDLHTDGAAIIAARFLGEFAGEAFEVRELQGREEAEGVEGGLVKAPASEKIENTFALAVIAAVGRSGFLRGFG